MNAAKVIQFPKQTDPQPKQEAGKSMYSDKFENGYVMSSRLYRKEVWPFLSDAARNVYAELENRINGHNKESDFVSYSQLQGGELEGSRKLSSRTVTIGVKELLKLGVISVIDSGKQGIKKYRLNDISLVDHFTKESTLQSKAVKESSLPSKVDHFTKESETTLPSKDTIDNKNLFRNKKNKMAVDNSESELFGNSVEYHRDDKENYTLRELANRYTVKSDFSVQAKNINSELSDDQIISELKNFVQWSTAREKTTAQGWMNYWIYRIQNLSANKPKAKSQNRSARASKNLTDSQIDMFSKKLCNLPDFACTYANTGESQRSFESRIAVKLREPENLKHWASYLRDVGFIGNLEGMS
ncbi:hypothetical protein [Acinetobacter haemolyticus]|uniref:hypothetical protein n=1 Tax=Acinetobacter haemolyticus TaxID=29430 RepID=UPI0013731B0A|nr:hypothetical protein [Acinetobacter haemolyticus]NAR60037.1 hypothetical protein [Acinetobacter haemolyticus]NAR92851.1 hypothetical protein [Acinetobacter haemolyticus]